MKIRITGLAKPQDIKRQGGLIKAQTLGEFNGQTPQEDNTSWIKRIFDYEYQHGSPTGTGLSDWGYHTRNPKTLDEAVGYFQQDYLPKVQGLPMGMRERAGDFLYNTGEDARLYMLDQYVRQYENMPNGLQDRGAYRAKGAKAGEFENLYKSYQAKIDALPIEERVKLMDTGRDYYYRNINTVNGKPSAAYNATWKPRLGIFGQYQTPKSITQSTTQAATQPVAQPVAQQQSVQQPVQQPVQQQAVAQPVEQTKPQYNIQTAPSLQIQQKPVGQFNLPTIVGQNPTGTASTTQATAGTTNPQLTGAPTYDWKTGWTGTTNTATPKVQQTGFVVNKQQETNPVKADGKKISSPWQIKANNFLKKVEKADDYVSDFGDSIFNAFNTYSQMQALDNQNQREEANRQMLRSQNASWNQQYDSTMNRGNFSQGPSSYGMFRPNQTFAQQGIEVPVSMDTVSKYTVDSFDDAAGINTIGIGTPEFPDTRMMAPSSYDGMDESTVSPENFANVDPNNLPLDADAMLAVIGTQESSSKPGQKALGLRTKLVGPGGKRGSASGTYQMTEGTLKGIYSKHFNDQYSSFGQFKQAFNTNPDVEYSAAKALMQDHIKNYGIYALGAWYQPSLAAKAAKGDLSVMNKIPAPEYGNKVTFGDYFHKSLNNYRKSLGLDSYSGVINTKPGVNISNLNPNLQAFASNVFSQFPGLKISSGNDSSKHMKGSRHYENKAIDIGANSSEKGAYSKLKQFLAQNPQVKQRYGIEDIIDEGDHLHIELMQEGGEYELTANQIMQIKAMGGDVEFI